MSIGTVPEIKREIKEDESTSICERQGDSY